MVGISAARFIGKIGHVQETTGPTVGAVSVPTKCPFGMKGAAIGGRRTVRCAPIIAEAFTNSAVVAACPIGDDAVRDRMSVFVQDDIGIFVVIDAAVAE